MVVNFPDFEAAVLMEDVTYRVAETQEVVTVPKGFVTDYASIPPLFEWWLRNGGARYQHPAIIHDWLYWTGREQTEADLIFYHAMRDNGVGWWKSGTLLNGLRVGGASGWRENQRNRARGLPRVIPERYLDRDQWTDSWKEYQAYLYDQGVRAKDEPVPGAMRHR